MPSLRLLSNKLIAPRNRLSSAILLGTQNLHTIVTSSCYINNSCTPRSSSCTKGRSILVQNKQAFKHHHYHAPTSFTMDKKNVKSSPPPGVSKIQQILDSDSAGWYLSNFQYCIAHQLYIQVLWITVNSLFLYAWLGLIGLVLRGDDRTLEQKQECCFTEMGIGSLNHRA